MFFFFFNDTATTEIYTLSLHDALPICRTRYRRRCVSTARRPAPGGTPGSRSPAARSPRSRGRSEEHTSELQSLAYLVCRLLLEKKKKEEVCTEIYIDLRLELHRVPRNT